MNQLAFEFNPFRLLATKVEPGCDWITEGREYIVTKVEQNYVIIIDDNGLKNIIDVGEYDYLNDYVTWVWK